MSKRLAILACGKSIDGYPGRGGDQYKASYDEVWALNSIVVFSYELIEGRVPI